MAGRACAALPCSRPALTQRCADRVTRRFAVMSGRVELCEWLIDAAELQKARSGEALVSSTEVASDVEF